MKKNCFAIFIALAVMTASCSRDKATLSGRIVGADSVKLYLERVMPGKLTTVDSTVTDADNNFRFDVALPDGQAAIFNLRSGNDAVPLIISPGEKVSLHSVGSIGRNYSVEGSVESSRVKELRGLLSKGARTLDSILTIYGFTFDEQKKKEVGAAYTNAYYKVKQEHIKFIVTDPGSLSSLYALYQRLPNDYALFNGEADVVYYRQVADSVEQRHPGSPYLKALRSEIAAEDANRQAAQKLSDKLSEGAVGYPDLDLPDMYGKKHKLSDLEGGVILVDFWSAATAEGTLNNAEMKELYAALHARGLEIYQVSVDETIGKPVWVSAVQQQKLPWVSVCDFQGGAGYAPRAYNVKKLPANFIIDRRGDIVARDLFGESLRKRIEQLL